MPLLTSAFLYVISKTAPGRIRVSILTLVFTAGCFLLLGFISAIRAVGVKTNQTLSLGAVLEGDGSFKTYKEAIHAKGLLYCASMNTAMNDHLAQFVRGAHAMAATALLFLLVACIPEAAATLKPVPEAVTQVKLTTPVEVTSPSALNVAPCVPSPQDQRRITALEKRIATLEGRRMLVGGRADAHAHGNKNK